MRVKLSQDALDSLFKPLDFRKVECADCSRKDARIAELEAQVPVYRDGVNDPPAVSGTYAVLLPGLAPFPVQLRVDGQFRDWGFTMSASTQFKWCELPEPPEQVKG